MGAYLDAALKLAPASGPATYLRLSETTGDYVDMLGSVIGTPVGALVRGVPGLLAGDPDGATRFDGLAAGASGITLGDNYDFPGTMRWSIVMWLSPDAAPATGRTIISKAGASPSGGWIVSYHGVGRPMAQRIDGTAGSDTVIAPTGPAIGVRNMLTVTYDGFTLRIATNADAAGEIASTRPMPGNALAVNVGRNVAGNNGFPGVIDELMIYPATVITDAQRAELYRLGSTYGGATIDGATVGVWADLGPARPPFVLDRDVLDRASSILNTYTTGLADITRDVIELDATWGATDWEGPMTHPDAGGCTLVLLDWDRAYDPSNGALGDPPLPGRFVQLRVDGQPFQTTQTETIGHDTAEGITTVECTDVLGVASGIGIDVVLPEGPIEDQIAVMQTATRRTITTEGAFVAQRAGEAFTGSLLEGLQRLTDAELGSAFANAGGGIVVRGRGSLPPDQDIKATIGDEPGIAVTELGSATNRVVANAVYISPIDDASPVMIWRDMAAQGFVGGEVSIEADASDLLLI